MMPPNVQTTAANGWFSKFGSPTRNNANTPKTVPHRIRCRAVGGGVTVAGAAPGDAARAGPVPGAGATATPRQVPYGRLRPHSGHRISVGAVSHTGQASCAANTSNGAKQRRHIQNLPSGGAAPQAGQPISC